MIFKIKRNPHSVRRNFPLVEWFCYRSGTWLCELCYNKRYRTMFHDCEQLPTRASIPEGIERPKLCEHCSMDY